MMPSAGSAKRRTHVYRSMNRPLTYMGIERTLFLLIGVSTAAVFNLFDSLPAAAIVFVGGLFFGVWATGTDPAFLRIILGSSSSKPRYDAFKRKTTSVRIL